MRERGEIFQAWSIPKLMDGSKTMTRRPTKYPPSDYVSINPFRKAPYEVGMTLWVRETFAFLNSEHIPVEHWNEDCRVVYRADHITGNDGPSIIKWKPSIYMPRRFSRIDLTVTGVRAEKVCDISEKHAKAEGVPPKYRDRRIRYRYGFEDMWDSIYGKKHPWDSTWCWAVSFERQAKEA